MPPRINLPLTSLRKSYPPILTLPQPSTGNNIPKSYHKTRRTWHPNVTRMDLDVQLLDTKYNRNNRNGAVKVLKGVKLSMRHLKGVDKAGSVEGCLLSRPPRDLTDFGKQLRSELFKKLETIRASQKIVASLRDIDSSIASGDTDDVQEKVDLSSGVVAEDVGKVFART